MRACLLVLSFLAFFAAASAQADGQKANFDVRGIVAAANQGSPPAQYQLGLMLLSGQGVTADRRKAGVWFLRAAKQGVDGAQFQVAKMILDKTVEGDKTAAYFWLVLCSSKGNEDRVALRDEVEKQLQPDLASVMRKKAAAWKPTLEQLQVNAPVRPAQ